MVDSLLEAVSGLQRAREEAAMRVATATAELQKIDEALERLRTDIRISPTSFKAQDFVSLGIVEAARRLLTEVGHEQTTRELADAMRARGVTTKSKDFVPTVYATLTNAKKDFIRKGDKWGLKK